MPQASVDEAKCKTFLVKMTFYYHANKTHFHKKGFARGLVLRVRVFGTLKCPIDGLLLLILLLLLQFYFCGQEFSAFDLCISMMACKVLALYIKKEIFKTTYLG